MVVVNVPTIDKRKRSPQKAIDQVVQQIVEKFSRRKSSYSVFKMQWYVFVVYNRDVSVAKINVKTPK